MIKGTQQTERVTSTELISVKTRLQPPTRPPIAAWLRAADYSQARFARLTGVTTRQVNAWCRSHAKTPRWALLIATLLRQHSPDAMAIALEEALLSHSTANGMPEPNADPVSPASTDAPG